jgi:hypothetical protein
MADPGVYPVDATLQFATPAIEGASRMVGSPSETGKEGNRLGGHDHQLIVNMHSQDRRIDQLE